MCREPAPKTAATIWNLPMANWLAKRYLDQVLYGIQEDRLVYPE